MHCHSESSDKSITVLKWHGLHRFKDLWLLFCGKYFHSERSEESIISISSIAMNLL